MSRRRATNAAPKKWQQKAIDAVAAGATVTEAAKTAGVDRATIYRALEADAEFRQAFDDGVEQGTDVIEAAATRRAVVGVAEPVIYQGQVTFVAIDKDGKECPGDSPDRVGWRPLTVNRPSDTLAIFLLKGRRPHKFRENMRHEFSGPNGGPIETKHTNEVKHTIDHDQLRRDLQQFLAGRISEDGNGQSLDSVGTDPAAGAVPGEPT